MTQFARKMIESGQLKGQYEWVPVYIGSAAPEAQPMSQPVGITLPMNTKKRYECLLCGKTYAAVNIFANHFAHTHKDKDTEKDAWRKHFKDTKV